MFVHLVLASNRRWAHPTFLFGPWNSSVQRRWKKPVISARSRLENRTLDPKLDNLMTKYRKLRVVLKLHEIMSKRPAALHVSVEMLTRWKNIVGLNVRVGDYLRRSPHIFQVYPHPVRKYPCCRMTRKMRDLINDEERVRREQKSTAVAKLKKLLMMSISGSSLHVHSAWLVRRELGLPDNFRKSILSQHPQVFVMVSSEIVKLISRDNTLAVAQVEKWREKEYREKWLSEFETKHAFPIQFPTGFRMGKGFREKMRNWQRLQYLHPYDKPEIGKEVAIRAKTCGGPRRYEKRAVAIIHELLSMTVEKMMTVERLAHFRSDLSLKVNVRDVLLDHPGIFYISTKANVQTVFLREAFDKGYLVNGQQDPIYRARWRMLELVSLGRRITRCPMPLQQVGTSVDDKVSVPVSSNRDRIISMLLSCS
ncbi:Ubiquitin carboxyl-terminal hydrolase-like protein [Zostera marina]|uniref:Ubiquitin carboxyl-terminal hydrolase-like protein n=1 Tax=Zostera marina TaxID=29655 RepID=A0A0K9Q1A8_ZOSMR|nr:Ubiquitin carboxyl-terminal hydrolase-like protein [Zostera marina]